MRKKLLIGFLSGFTVISFILSGCDGLGNAKPEHGVTDNSLYAHGMELIGLMDEMVENDTYREIFTVSEEIAEVLDQLDEGDYSQPRMVCEIKFSEDSKNQMIAGLAPEADLNLMSEELQNNLKKKLSSSIVSQLNGRSGVTNLAAASICTAEKSFVNESVEEDVLYLYVFKDTQPVAVSFQVGEGGAVSASSTFVMVEELTAASQREIIDYFFEMGAEITMLVGE